MPDEAALMALADRMLWITALVAAPILIASLVVGLVVGIIQAATSVNEQTLTFVPIDRRLIAITLLSSDERAWVDDYHRAVRTKVGPLLDGEDRASRMGAANALAALGRSDEALAAYEAISVDWPDFPFARIRQGALLEDLGD